ncbi:hypothetical protein CAEBREN_00564 [Caenorhabditis brenneri]|uniref:Uncharacterized protein n=1 Tax=Caenorhabditis brenneri TaxID=135651 RepID=G0NG95_CAEBE|nr:hypothetical protein CAEBREN_00564 [Caenorhabditis brenneri]
MGSVLHDYDDDNEKTAHELSEIELEELFITKFVEPEKKEDENGIETARACGSPMEICSPIQGDEFLLDDHDHILEEHSCLVRPIQEQVNSDSAVELLSRIRAATEEDLKKTVKWSYFEKSRKWKNTSRVSELNLINSVLPLVNHRPTHLHIYCRRLIESDLPNIIGQCLLDVDPPTKISSLFRISLKTEMPLKQFIGQLGILAHTNPNIEIRDAIGTALRRNLDGSNQKFLTFDIPELAELEQKLSHSSVQPMIGTVRFAFRSVGKPFVTVNVEYHNEIDSHGRRCKAIVIEQLVSPLPGALQNRRVTFGSPLVERIHVFEIEENLPFHSLKYPFKIQNLIDFLQKVDPLSFKNVTFR